MKAIEAIDYMYKNPGKEVKTQKGIRYRLNAEKAYIEYSALFPFSVMGKGAWGLFQRHTEDQDLYHAVEDEKTPIDKAIGAFCSEKDKIRTLVDAIIEEVKSK